MKKAQLLRIMFLKSLILSSSTFGGGFVIVSLMRDIYVEKMHLLTEDDMMDITAISQSAPGPVAVNASILLGYKTAGIAGIFVCLIGTVLPPLLIMARLSCVYGLVRGNPVFSKLMMGMRAGVAAVILYAVMGMTKSALRTHRPVYYVLFAAVFFLMIVLKADAVVCIVLAAVLGVADGLTQGKHTLPKTGCHSAGKGA